MKITDEHRKRADLAIIHAGIGYLDAVKRIDTAPLPPGSPHTRLAESSRDAYDSEGQQVDDLTLTAWGDGTIGIWYSQISVKPDEARELAYELLVLADLAEQAADR